MRLDDGADLGRQALFVTTDKKVIHELTIIDKNQHSASRAQDSGNRPFGGSRPQVAGSNRNPTTLLRLYNHQYLQLVKSAPSGAVFSILSTAIGMNIWL